MKPRHFLSAVDDDAILTAIAEAEKKTTGRIHVFVSHHRTDDAVAAAQKHFVQFEMDHTPHRNGVLIYVSPRSHKFAVIGDRAIHEKCGDEFWTSLTAEMTGHFKTGKLTEAILHAIGKAGELLSEKFPANPSHRNN
ncbi:MAG TPA: DUF5130 family protein [Tepidisphaeraceae bacterium]|nr:DUF5130 family protein [Tepidisphaeraceae bacterium]